MFPLLVGLAYGLACDIPVPMCPEGPSNLTAEATAACVDLPDGIGVEPLVEYAYAEIDSNGHLVVSVSTVDLGCGVSAADLEPSIDCDHDGWAYSVDVPPDLFDSGPIVVDQNPVVLAASAWMSEGNGVGTGWGAEDFRGTIEIVSIAKDCVTVVLDGFGNGASDPVEGPDLDGVVTIPRCD